MFMVDRLRSIKIRHHLLLWFSLMVAAALAAAGWIIFSHVRESVEKNITDRLSASTRSIRTLVRTAATVSIRNHLQAIAENNYDILKTLNDQVEKGQILSGEAKRQAEKLLLGQQIGSTGYIYVIDSSGHLVVHPSKEMKGQDMSSHWLAQKQVEQRRGYVEYSWDNPGESRPRPKALFMTYFEPWDWIISVTCYRDEFGQLIDISDLEEGIRSQQLGTGGYTFIVAGNGNIVLHPHLSNDLSVEDLMIRDVLPVPEMMEQKEGQVFKPSGRNGVGGRMFFYSYIPELDWIVASTADLDQVYRPLEGIRFTIIGTLVGILALLIPLSYWLGASITKPLSGLLDKMKTASDGNYDTLADSKALGEVGILAKQFNEYMQRLRFSSDELREEVAERAKAEQQLKLFAKVFDNALEGISITDAQGRIVAVNQAFTDITGYGPEEAIGQNPRILKSDRHPPDFYTDMWKELTTSGAWKGEIWNRRKAGEAFPEILSISAIHDDQGNTTHYVAVFHDITEMKRKEEEIQHQAHHDALTGLPNRTLARDRLFMSIAHAKRSRSKLAVFFLDLDNFKHINDSLGHAAGDELLIMVGKRLRSVVREEDTVARLGGDEFQITAVEITATHQIIDLAERLLDTFLAPFQIDAHELYVTLSLGISIFPQDGKDVDTLVRHADVAMYQAKLRGKNSYCLFTSELSEKAVKRLKLESEMRQALQKKEFLVYYQPKVEPLTLKVTGVEALARWRKPDGTVVSPADFIPLAEETGLITKLGEQVLDDACKAAQVLDVVGFQDMSIAVNLSPHQFRQENLVDQVFSILEQNRINPSRLELEITESTMISDLEDSSAKLQQLGDAGISISIDDFGTGYSSLYYLKSLPIDSLKIDRSFIRDITTDPSDAKLVETIILMASNMGIGVIAEGVENIEQLAMLGDFGCKLIQGYYFSPPISLEELTAYLKTTKRT